MIQKHVSQKVLVALLQHASHGKDASYPPPIGAVICKQESVHKVPKSVLERFLEGRSSIFMRLAEHLTALRAWCKQCLPGC